MRVEKPTRKDRREAAKEQIENVGRTFGDKANEQAYRVCAAATRKALKRWVDTGKMFG